MAVRTSKRGIIPPDPEDHSFQCTVMLWGKLPEEVQHKVNSAKAYIEISNVRYAMNVKFVGKKLVNGEIVF